MSKEEKRYVLKPKFHLGLIPKRDLGLGFFMLIFGSFCFGYLFLGIFLGFYVGTTIYNYPLQMIYVLSTKDLKIIVFLFSILGTLTASSFSYSIWFNSFQKNKNHKKKASFISHTSKDIVWITSSFMTRLVTLILGVISSLGIFYLRKELLVVSTLCAIALLLREDNHLKQSFQLKWQFSLAKLLFYFVLASSVTLLARPYVSSLNNGLLVNTIETEYGINLPSSKHPKRFHNVYPVQEHFFFKKNNNLYLSQGGNGLLLQDARVYNTICSGGMAKRLENLFYIDANTPMKDIDELAKTGSSWNPIRLKYAVKTDYDLAFERPSYASFYGLIWYVVVKNNQEEVTSPLRTEIEMCESGPPLPPLPEMEMFKFDFDNHMNHDVAFAHLHLNNDSNFYWNDQKIASTELITCIDTLFGTEKGVVLTYDENVTFQSVTSTWEYLESIKRHKLAEYEKKNSIDLFQLEFDDKEKFDLIMEQFNLRRAVLVGFYNIQ